MMFETDHDAFNQFGDEAVHELHDTLFQGFFGASLLLHQAVEQPLADCPSKPALSCALRLVNQANVENGAAIEGIHRTSTAPSGLEQAFSTLLSEVATGRDLRLRLFVEGEPWILNPAIQEQLFLIGREAAMNALRHSQATKIEVEVQYLRDLLRVFVRDNGRGINPEAVQKESDSHWGLHGMRRRAENIGARFIVLSRVGAGTKCASPFRLTSRNDNPQSQSLGTSGNGSRTCKPSESKGLERRVRSESSPSLACINHDPVTLVNARSRTNKTGTGASRRSGCGGRRASSAHTQLG